MKKTGLLVFMLLSTVALFGQTTVEGRISDEDTGEELISANVIFYQNGLFITGISTDFEGNYKITLDPGKYDVTASYVGYPNKKMEGVIIEPGKVNRLDIALGAGEIFCYYPFYYHDHLLIFQADDTTAGQTFDQSNVEKLPTRNIREISAMAPGVSIGN